MQIFSLAVATLLPVLVAVTFYLADKKTKFRKLSYRNKQIIIGVAFGIVAILATEFGTEVEGAILNVRTAAPMTAGLLFGGPAGIIAGIIGGVERWISVYWGGGEYTRLACTLGTIMAGLFAAIMRKYIFDNKKASFTAGLTVGMTAEVLHMLLVFVTNMGDIHRAFTVVEKCAPIMVLLNALSVALSLGVVSFIGKEKIVKKNQKQIAQIYRSGLMVCVVLGFCFTCIFTAILQSGISDETAQSTLELTLKDVQQNLNDTSADALGLYTGMIAADINMAENTDQTFFEDLCKSYTVPEIYLVGADGVVKAGNISSYVGNAVPSKLVLSAYDNEKVCDYGKSFVDTGLDMQYVGARVNDEDYVLVGFDNEYIGLQTQKYMQLICSGRHFGENGYIMICDESGNIICSGNNNGLRTLKQAGIDIDLISKNSAESEKINKTKVVIMYNDLDTPAGAYKAVAVMPESEAAFARNTSVYIMAFMEILVFAALYINVYFLTKRVVVDNIHKVNKSLSMITDGNLNEEVNVRESEEFASLTDDINSTVSTLKHYIDEAAARIDKELEFAKAIQHSALPSVFPPYPNRKDFDIFALMDTAKEVGGDFYDFYLLDNDRLGFLIADVSGKGIPAAMFMMTAKTVIKGLAESGMEVDEIFTQANATLCDGNDAGMFVTAWIGILDLRTGILSFANAGHNPPLIYHKNGKFEYLRTRPNFVLAGMKKTRYKKQEMQLLPADEIFLYTDGVTEAMNDTGEMFREERLIEVLNKNPQECVEKRCKNLLKELEWFVNGAEQSDDITMLSVKLNHIQTFECITVYPDLNSTNVVSEFLDSKITRAQVSKKTASKIRVCTDEIFSNILRYSKATKADISFKSDENLITLSFSDNGVQYDPTKTKEPDISLTASEREIGGLGIYMVKKSAKSLNYAYTDEKNVLTLTFDCQM